VNPLAGQDEYETLETFFVKIDLSFAERLVKSCFHTHGPGRPPRSPLGVFRAFIIMRMKRVPSLRALARLLNVNRRLRRLCLIKKGEGGYPRSVLSRFTRRVGAEKLNQIIEDKVVTLLKSGGAGWMRFSTPPSSKLGAGDTPSNNKSGYSDRDARVGRTGRSYQLGYKLHLSVDWERKLPLAHRVAPANHNEKRHSTTLLEKTKRILKKAGAKLRRVIADSQYSSQKLRETAETVIPFPANQRPGVKDLLRVDKWFRSHGPEHQRHEYRKRSAVETVFSFLKTQYSMTVNKVRGLKNVGIYVLYSLLALILNREAAEKLGRPDKATSPTYFNT